MCKYTRIHFGSFCMLCLEIYFFGDKADKAKLNVIKNVTKEKAVFMML